MRRALAPALLALVLLAAPARADEWNKSFTVSGRTTISVRSGDGHVHVVEGAPGAVAVHVRTWGWRIGRQVQVDARQSPGRIDVEAREPHWNWGLTFSFHDRRSLEIEVAVPRESDLEIHTQDGGVVVEHVNGHVTIESGDGHVRAESVRGDLRLHTGDGAVDAHDLDGRLSATTGDGPVRVGGRFDALEVSTGDGRVVVEAGEGSRVGDGWSIESGDGALTLRLASTLAADLDVRTSDGRITVGMPLSIDRFGGGHVLYGSLHGGGPRIRVRSGDGPIRLEPLNGPGNL